MNKLLVKIKDKLVAICGIIAGYGVVYNIRMLSLVTEKDDGNFTSTNDKLYISALNKKKVLFFNLNAEAKVEYYNKKEK